MITELIFENLNSIELETEVSRFLRIKVKSIEKIYFKQEVSRYIDPINDSQIGNYPLDVWHICYLIYVPKEDEGEKK